MKLICALKNDNEQMAIYLIKILNNILKQKNNNESINKFNEMFQNVFSIEIFNKNWLNLIETILDLSNENENTLINYINLDLSTGIENQCPSDICNYPGSFCTIVNGQPKCACDFVNCFGDNIKVCGDDGETYASYCDMMKISCLKQLNIQIAYMGQCSMGTVVF